MDRRHSRIAVTHGLTSNLREGLDPWPQVSRGSSPGSMFMAWFVAEEAAIWKRGAAPP